MATITITRVRKDNGNHYNPYEAVTHYEWREGNSATTISPRHEVVGWLNGSLGFPVEAWVQRTAPAAKCFVNTSAHGTKFLQTHADATSANNLLNLEEC